PKIIFWRKSTRLSPTKMTNCGIVSTVIRHIGCLNRLGSRKTTTTGLLSIRRQRKIKKPVCVTDDKLEYNSNSEEQQEEHERTKRKGSQSLFEFTFFLLV